MLVFIISTELKSSFQTLFVVFSITIRQIAQRIQLYVKNAARMEFPEQKYSLFVIFSYDSAFCLVLISHENSGFLLCPTLTIRRITTFLIEVFFWHSFVFILSF